MSALQRAAPRSYWRMRLRALRRSPSAVVGLTGLALLALAAVFAPILSPFSPTEQNYDALRSPPTAEHPFGTDDVGRDVLSRVLWGGRQSLLVGVVAVAIGVAGGEAEFQEHLKAIGRLHAKSPEEVEATFRYHLGRLEPHIPHLFARIPKAPYDVERLDRALEAGMSYGYYEPPNPNEPRGIYHYNGSGLDTRSQLNAAALIFHELIPGHHFHLARQQENESVHPIRREALGMSGYNEGWAEYASELPREIGLYDDPYDWYGRLVHQRFLAQRLVIDTGMNVLGWSLEQGRAYMRENTVESETQVASETLRYSTDLPAQALAYRLGFLKLRDLRAKAQHALGSAFDLPAFHEAVLAPGALPLAVLEPHIDHFIAEAKSHT